MKFNRLIDLSFDLINLPETTNKHFSFLLLRNNIVCMGFSSLKTHPMAKKNNFQWEMKHAELDLLTKCPFKMSELGRFRLVNTRVNTLGQICNSRPCRSCEEMLSGLPLKEIWFTTEKGEFIRL